MSRDPDRTRTIIENLRQIDDSEVLERELESLCGEDSDLKERVLRDLKEDFSKSAREENPPSKDTATGQNGTVVSLDNGGVQKTSGQEQKGQEQTSTPGQNTVCDIVDSSLDQFVGDELVGGYHIIRKLGEGGFGEVYHARQLEPVRRDVAIKILKKGMDTKEVLARFQSESRALAMMSHPGLAKVFDTGATEAGQPFFVMEMVEGVPITDFCDRNRLGIRQRVELFIEVCEAVQHAHHKGVIHRDIKPSNILVVRRGDRSLPVVIDFGVAKATQGWEDSAGVTQMNQIVGTPTYMSPEQAEFGGQDIDMRTDVYSLGVVLYELLCGVLPLDRKQVQTRSAEKIAQVLREFEPQRPSLRFSSVAQDRRERKARARGESATSLTRALRKELDWIALKCLQKDRNERYAAVHAIAADCKRYLNNEPVQAKQSSLIYNLQKFSVKHRGLVASMAIAMIFLVGGLIVSSITAGFYRENYREVVLLADLNKLQLAQREALEVVKVPYEERHDFVVQWLGRARGVLAREEQHRATLGRLKERAADGFVDDIEAWQFESQTELVELLDWLKDSEQGLRLFSALKERTPTSSATAGQWRKCEQDLKERYPTWRILPRQDLHPIGTNPRTGLWEFAHLKTGVLPTDFVSPPDVHTALVFVLVPGGKFVMGSPEGEEGRVEDAELQHEVELSPFLISKWETTQAIWYRIMQYRHNTTFPGELRPTPVSWFDCQEFGRKIGARLPTEAEWEYSCRAGSHEAYAGTGDLDDMGWFDLNSGNELHRVGLKQANAYGLYDMHGNAHEWVYDRYAVDFYEHAEASGLDPVNEPEIKSFEVWSKLEAAHSNANDIESRMEYAKHRVVMRGGPAEGKAIYCRSANRYYNQPGVNIPNCGFRPAIDNVVSIDR